MHYRPEIDGLRAVAVVSVILFHAGMPAFSGGFVGVDVFFVISGYLITSVIARDVASGTFSFARFYERRARRILPALALVCVACLPFAWLWMLPSELEAFGKSLWATALSYSNVLFWKETGYFAASAELKPLLHTWSLAVEEQFYILFPPFLIALRRLRWNRARALAALCIVSFAIALALGQMASEANFFLLPSRLWELGVGALLAFGSQGPPRRIPRAAMAGVGLAMILAAILLVGEDVAYPGPYTLLPVIGTAMIIAGAGAGDPVGRLLSWKPMVTVGLVSYSAYLWHQPLFAFARLRLPSVEPPVYAVLIVATFLLAGLSWRFVEQPARRARLEAKTLVRAALLLVALFALPGLALDVAGNMKDEQRMLDERLRANHGLSPSCEGAIAPECRVGTSPRILVWGDSYAMQLAGALRTGAGDAGILQITKSACAPLPDYAAIDPPRFPAAKAHECIDFSAAAVATIEAEPSLRHAAVSLSILRLLRASELMGAGGETGDRVADLARRIGAMMDWLRSRGIEPILFAPLPYDGRDLGRCVLRAQWAGLPAGQCDIRGAFRDPDVTRVLELVALRHRVFDFADILCAETVCRTVIDGVPVYRDDGHLSNEASRRLAGPVTRALLGEP